MNPYRSGDPGDGASAIRLFGRTAPSALARFLQSRSTISGARRNPEPGPGRASGERDSKKRAKAVAGITARVFGVAGVAGVGVDYSTGAFGLSA